MFMTAIVLAVVLAQPPAVLVHDGDHHANSDPQIKSWFDGLASKMLCCSFADGSTVDDVDWCPRLLPWFNPAVW